MQFQIKFSFGEGEFEKLFIDPRPYLSWGGTDMRFQVVNGLSFRQ